MPETGTIVVSAVAGKALLQPIPQRSYSVHGVPDHSRFGRLDVHSSGRL